MIELIVLNLLILIGLGSPGNLGVSPESLYDAGLLRKPPPACREPTAGESHELGLDGKGKASTYSIDGTFLCERRIFDYGDRDSYTDFVLSSAAVSARSAARQAAAIQSAEPQLAARMWTVRVAGSPSQLQQHLTYVYRQALAESLGSGRVARHATAPSPSLELLVNVRPVLDPELLFDITVAASTGSDSRRRVWQL